MPTAAAIPLTVPTPVGMIPFQCKLPVYLTVLSALRHLPVSPQTKATANLVALTGRAAPLILPTAVFQVRNQSTTSPLILGDR